MKERLKRIRKDANLTQESFGAEIGATRGMISQYEAGLVIPPQPIQKLICQTFNVNPVWLETGEGKPYKEGLMPELVHALRQMPSVQAALERLLPIMTDEDWRRLDEVVSRFVSSHPKE